MKNRKSTLLIFTMLLTNALLAQYSISGIVKDADTKQALSCVQVNVYSHASSFDTTFSTSTDGKFNINGLEEGFYSIYFEKDNYRGDNNNEYEIISNSLNLNIELFSYDSETYKIEDIANEDAFDFTFGFDLYSPAMQDSDSKFKSVFSFDYAYEGKVKLANRVQLGFRYAPLKLKWMQMNNDTLITNVPHTNERYFEASTSLGIYTRFILSTTGSDAHRGMFFDIGASYSLPYYFSYTYFTEDHIKTSQNKIRNFNDFQAMVRLGFYWGSIRANYRFTDVMKDNFVESPKLTLGVEFNIPMSN